MNRDRAIQVTFFLLRIVCGFLFIQIGGLKLFGWLGGMPPNGASATFPSQYWIGGFLEVVGGVFILLGLLIRPVAFILAGEMAVAYWQFHAPKAPWPAQNMGQPAVLFCFIFLFMAAYGGGPWSLDALIWRKRASPIT